MALFLSNTIHITSAPKGPSVMGFLPSETYQNKETKEPWHCSGAGDKTSGETTAPSK